MIDVPQPGMFREWKEWANQLLSSLQRYEEPPAKALEVQGDFADDLAAAAAGVEIGGLYRTGSVVKVRVT